MTIALVLALGAGLLRKRAEHAEGAQVAQPDAPRAAPVLASPPRAAGAAATEPPTLQYAAEQVAAQAGELLSADVQQHARGMLALNLTNAVEMGDEQDARWLRDQLDDPRLKAAVTLNDLEALELAIDCLGHQSDAREEARDLLEFAPPSLLSDALRWACE